MKKKYNIGDIVELSPSAISNGKKLHTSFQVEVVGEKEGKIYVLLPREYGEKINYDIIRRFNLDSSHYNKYGYYFMSWEVTSLIRKGKISLSLESGIERWKEFVYGRQIKNEKENSLPVNDRPFEFL